MTEVRYDAARVRPLAEQLRDVMAGHAERVEIGGSLRREKPLVKDVELVILNPRESYLPFTEELIADDRAAKAVYPDGKNRWGQRYRGVSIDGMTCELFTADQDNWGYQFFLRTGPGDMNQAVVTRIKYGRAPFRLADGYVWAGERKLRVATEADWFTLLGIPFVEPRDRSVPRLKALLNARGHRWGDATALVVVDSQTSLFDADGLMKREPADDRRARIAAERAYNAEAVPRTYRALAAKALAAGDTARAETLLQKADEAARKWADGR